MISISNCFFIVSIHETFRNDEYGLQNTSNNIPCPRLYSLMRNYTSSSTSLHLSRCVLTQHPDSHGVFSNGTAALCCYHMITMRHIHMVLVESIDSVVFRSSCLTLYLRAWFSWCGFLRLALEITNRDKQEHRRANALVPRLGNVVRKGIAVF